MRLLKTAFMVLTVLLILPVSYAAPFTTGPPVTRLDQLVITSDVSVPVIVRFQYLPPVVVANIDWAPQLSHTTFAGHGFPFLAGHFSGTVTTSLKFPLCFTRSAENQVSVNEVCDRTGRRNRLFY